MTIAWLGIMKWWLVFALVIVFAMWLWVRLWLGLFPLRHQPDEVHEVQTEDGWTLSLWRWRARGKDVTRRYPVLLCHGLAVNRFNLDQESPNSVARYLSEQGFDCWVAELRCAGTKAIVPPSDTNRHDFCFDHLVDFDVPALIETVQTHTAAAQVHWIGHSTGGMVIYGSEPSKIDPLLRSFVAYCSPAHFTPKEFPLISLFGLVRWMRVLPLRWLGRLGLPLTPYVSTWSVPFLYPFHVRFGVLMRTVLHAFSDVSVRLLGQYVKFIKTQTLCREDGGPVYEERMRFHRCPALFLAGARDRIAFPANVYYAFQRWGGPRAWRIYGGWEPSNDELERDPDDPIQHEPVVWRDHKTTAYGHGDSVLAIDAPDVVFPEILAWLELWEEDQAVLQEAEGVTPF